jgi:hypothetical protein
MALYPSRARSNEVLGSIFANAEMFWAEISDSVGLKQRSQPRICDFEKGEAMASTQL